MISTLFKKTDMDDAIKILDTKVFNESKAESILKKLDNINVTDNKNQNLIHKMAEKNRIDAIIWLKEKGVDLSLEDNEAQTPLIIAAKRGYTELIKTLINLGANPEYKNKEKRIALQEAAKNANLDAYCTLSRVTENRNNIDSEGKNVLFDAISTSNENMIREVLLDESVDRSIEDLDGNCVIFLEPSYSNIEITNLLLKYGFDFNKKDFDGKNILFYFLENPAGKLETFKRIIIKYENLLNEKDIHGNSLLHHAVKILLNTTSIEPKDPLCQLIKIMFDYEIDSTLVNNEGYKAFDLALESERVEIIELFLKNFYDPNIVDKNGETPLSIMALKGKKYKDIITLLLSYGANPNIKNNDGETVIEKLISVELYFSENKKISSKLRQIIPEKNEGYLSLLEQIIYNSEANLRQLDSTENPYFFDAVLHGNIEIVKILTYFGADINQVGKEGLNIIYILMEKFKDVTIKNNVIKYHETLKNIIFLGANVNARDNYGGITLHKAILDHDISIAKMLLTAGADIRAIDNRGRNMIHNCIWKAKIKTLRYILSLNNKLLNLEDKFGVLPIHYAAFLGYTELVLELINLGSHVSSYTVKSEYIKKFLERFHKNLTTLEENAKNIAEKNKIATLVGNMKDEFSIDI
jgi:ankyrin repeat protein